MFSFLDGRCTKNQLGETRKQFTGIQAFHSFVEIDFFLEILISITKTNEAVISKFK